MNSRVSLRSVRADQEVANFLLAGSEFSCNIYCGRVCLAVQMCAAVWSFVIGAL